METFIERDPPEFVPEVGEVPINKTRLGGGVDANGWFGDLPSEVVLKVFLELLFVPQVSGDVGHHDSSIADSLMLIVCAYHRIDGGLEEVLWVGVSILSLGPIGVIFRSSSKVSSSHPHKSQSYPQEGYHPSDRDPEDDDEMYPKERPALRGTR